MGGGRWAVEHLDDGAFLGWCGFRYDADDDRFDLGYRFLESTWGRGIGAEAALACMQWADEALAGREIVGRARVENTASLRILEKCGGVDIGTEDDDGLVRVFRLRANPGVLEHERRRWHLEGAAPSGARPCHREHRPVSARRSSCATATRNGTWARACARPSAT